MKHFILSLLLLSVLALTSCSVLVKNNLSKLSQLTSNQSIAINQLGYLNQGDKFATIPNVTASRFDLIDAKTNKVVYTAKLSGVKIWALSGNDTFKLANFSEFVTSGHYFLRVNGVRDSSLFPIGNDVYDSLSTAALKYYYLNRSSIDIEEKYAGIYARPMGHKDNNVGYHPSAEASDNYKAQRTKANKGS
jgi:endoglucanase